MARTTATPAVLDKKWQAEDDQRTLARAAEIVADTVRCRAAMSQLTRTTRGITRMVDLLSARPGKAGGKP